MLLTVVYIIFLERILAVAELGFNCSGGVKDFFFFLMERRAIL